MIKKDYMKEIENSLKIAKREVDKSIIEGDIIKANNIINKELKGLVGLDISTIDTLSFDSIKDVISRKDEYNGEKYIALGELLCLQGFVCQSNGDEDRELRYYIKSLMAFVEAYEEDDEIDRKYFEDGKHIVDILSQYSLLLNEERTLFRFYEIIKSFDKAEDILFYMIKKSDKDSGIISDGIAYYERLKLLSDEELEEGNLSRDEVEDSYMEIKNFHVDKGE